MSTSDAASSPAPNATSESDPGDPRREDGLFDRLLAFLRLRNGPSMRDNLDEALDESAAGFSPEERAMLRNVLALRATRVDDVMVPRVDIIAVAADASLGELLRLFRTAGHSRLPVYVETLDDPRGMVHIRDILDHIAAAAESAGSGHLDVAKLDLKAPLASADLLRPVLFVPPSMLAMDLLAKMQASRTHIALVIDEYGGTDGLCSIEDLVEIIVGDIEDEHDEAEAVGVSAEGDSAFVADSRASLEEVSAAIGVDLAHADFAEEVDTIGGLIATLAGRVPVRGEIVGGPDGLEFEILDADPRRIRRLRIHRRGSRGAASPRLPRRRRPVAGGNPRRGDASSAPRGGPARGLKSARPA